MFFKFCVGSSYAGIPPVNNKVTKAAIPKRNNNKSDKSVLF